MMRAARGRAREGPIVSSAQLGTEMRPTLWSGPELWRNRRLPAEVIERRAGYADRFPADSRSIRWYNCGQRSQSGTRRLMSEGNGGAKKRFGVFEFDPSARELTKHGVSL